MSISNQRKRVAKLEQAHAERMWQERLKDCNCDPHGVWFGEDPEPIGTCPVHGVRDIGRRIVIQFVAPDHKFDEFGRPLPTYRDTPASSPERPSASIGE
jgi:hypothetical protein